MTDWLPALAALGMLVVSIYGTLTRRSKRRRDEIQLLEEERGQLLLFVEEIRSIGGSKADENTVEPLRTLLRSCRRTFDKELFESAIGALDRVRSSKDRVVQISARIKATEAAHQAELEAAQADLSHARLGAITLMRDAAREELARVTGRLEELGQAG